jgi:hypothetical protein
MDGYEGRRERQAMKGARYIGISVLLDGRNMFYKGWQDEDAGGDAAEVVHSLLAGWR